MWDSPYWILFLNLYSINIFLYFPSSCSKHFQNGIWLLFLYPLQLKNYLQNLWLKQPLLLIMILWVRNLENIWLACLWCTWYHLGWIIYFKVTSLPHASHLGARQPFSAHALSPSSASPMTWACHSIMVSEYTSCYPLSWWLFSTGRFLRLNVPRDSWRLLMTYFGETCSNHLIIEWLSGTIQIQEERTMQRYDQGEVWFLVGANLWRFNYHCTLYPWGNP